MNPAIALIVGGVLIVAGQAARAAFWSMRTAILADNAIEAFGGIDAFTRAVRRARHLDTASIALASAGLGGVLGALLSFAAQGAAP